MTHKNTLITNKNSLTKKEQKFLKLKDKFDDAILTHEEMWGMPMSRIMEYLTKAIRLKYKNNNIPVNCPYCASTIIYETGRCITDEDLLAVGAISKKFRHS